MAGNLLGRQDGLLNRGQRGNLSQLAELHILQALRVLGQSPNPAQQFEDEDEDT
jgi:hypothetical protein